MECDDGVATRCIGEGVRVVPAGGDSRVLVPVKGVAGNGRGVAGVAVVDGEVECDDGVAAGGVVEGVRVVAAGGDSRVLLRTSSSPVEASTSQPSILTLWKAKTSPTFTSQERCLISMVSQEASTSRQPGLPPTPLPKQSLD